MRSYIYCMVDDENSYDYEVDGLWTDNKEVVDIWFKAGVKEVVALDALSLGMVTSYRPDEWMESRDN